MSAHTIEISDVAALDSLEVQGSLTRPARGEIILRLTGLDAQEQGDWQRRLTRKVFSCGCGMSAGLAMGGLISFAAWRLAGPAGLSGLTWVDILLALLTFVVGTGVGKALGLAAARVTLRRSTIRLHALVASRIADTVELTHGDRSLHRIGRGELRPVR